jgi:hypothetical protein
MELSPFNNLDVFLLWYDVNVRYSNLCMIEDIISYTKSYFKYVGEQKWYIYINGEWKIVHNRLPYMIYKIFYGYFIYHRKDIGCEEARESSFLRHKQSISKLYYDEEFKKTIDNMSNKRNFDEINEEDVMTKRIKLE